MAATTDEIERVDDRPDVELRFDAPRWIVDVIDAHVAAGMGRKTSRNKIAVSVLARWATDQIHLATLVSRLTRGNGNAPPSEWGEIGD